MPIDYFEEFKRQQRQPARPQAPTPAAPAAPQSRLAPITTTVGKVLDVLGRPGAATAGFISGINDGNALSRGWDNLRGARRDSFDTFLKEDVGMDDSWVRHGLGFAGDLVLDPLNLLPVGAVAKGIGKVADATGIAGAARRVAASPVAKALGSHFSTTAGLPSELAGARRLMDAERRYAPQRKIEELTERYGDLSRADRETVLEGLSAGAVRPQEIINPLTGEVTQDVAKREMLDARMVEQKRILDDYAAREQRAGLLPKDVTRKTPLEGMEGSEQWIAKSGYDPDYFPRDYSDVYDASGGVQLPRAGLSVKNPHARHATTESFGELKAKGGETDMARAALMREAGSDQRLIVTKFLEDTLKQYGVPVKNAPDGWRTLQIPAELPMAKRLAARAVPPEIAANLDAVVAGGKKATALGETFDKGMDLWRTFATVVRPGFHGTNFAGNMWNSYLGGLNPLTKGGAKAFQLAAKNWDEAPEAIGRYSGKEIADAMKRYGVVGSSFTRELGEKNFKGALTRALDAKQRGPLSLTEQVGAKLKSPLQTMRDIGGGVEDYSKRALFLDALQKGESLEDAALKVKKFLFDYGDITDTERTLRRAVPFYTWLRKNTPLQAEMLLKDPAKFAKVAHATNASENAANEHGEGVPAGERPDWVQRAGGVQLPWASSEGGANYYLPNLPFMDLNKFAVPGGSSVGNATADLLSGLGPAFKAPIELATNKSLFTRKPLYDDQQGLGDMQKAHPIWSTFLPDGAFPQGKGFGGERQAELPFWLNYATQQIPIAGSGAKLAGGVGDALTRMLGGQPLPDAMRSGDRPPLDILSYLSGLTVVPTTPAEERAALGQARKRASQRKSQERKHLPNTFWKDLNPL